MWGSLPMIAPILLGRLVRYAAFIVALFHRPWRTYLIHVRIHVTCHTSWWALIDMCFFVGPDTRWREGLVDRFPMRRVRPFLCLAAQFYLHFELSPSYARDSKSGTQRVPRHISPYCPQNSAHTDWFCSGGSVCSIPPWKVSLFVGHHFALQRNSTRYLKFYMTKAVLPIYWMMLRMIGFWWVDCGFLGCWNRSQFSGLV
jgi:hypothetical protein